MLPALGNVYEIIALRGSESEKAGMLHRRWACTREPDSRPRTANPRGNPVCVIVQSHLADRRHTWLGCRVGRRPDKPTVAMILRVSQAGFLPATPPRKHPERRIPVQKSTAVTRFQVYSLSTSSTTEVAPDTTAQLIALAVSLVGDQSRVMEQMRCSDADFFLAASP